MINIINNALEQYLKVTQSKNNILLEAMRYGVFNGGKRLRPQILISTCVGLGGDLSSAIPFACAIEMIHSYSLIHDDLPAMDNDDLRRGKPTNHKVFGEAIAILAGDALLNKAYQIMSVTCLRDPTLAKLHSMTTIATAAGAYGMLGGQTVDIISENKMIDEETLLYIHMHKTANLIKASLLCGGFLGGEDFQPRENLEKLEEAGNKIGLAFQIKDDLNDLTETTESIGKPAFSDLKNNKATYITVFGEEQAREDYRSYLADALEILRTFKWRDDSLLSLINSL